MSDEKKPSPPETEPEPATRGIPPAKTGALHVLQQAGAPGFVFSPESVGFAAHDILKYHDPDAVAVAAHEKLRNAAESFLVVLVKTAPSGPERSTAISRAREALFWANAAVALKDK